MKNKFFKTNKKRQSVGALHATPLLHRAIAMTALLLLFCPVVLSAQTGNGVTVENLSVHTGSPTTVTFDVRWDKADMPPVWSDTVWVFVDYNDNGVMKRLPLNTGATLIAPSMPTATIEVPNSQGAWVVGNARSTGSFSATVQLFTDTPVVAGACAYASNYPPLAKYTAADKITFTGTPTYSLVLEYYADGSTISASAGEFFDVPQSYTLRSFTDKTGAPGTFSCMPPAAPTVAEAAFCFGQPAQLTALAPNSDIITIAWYDAPVAGTLLHTGNVYPLPPLYNTEARYYAQANNSILKCVSARTAVNYTVNNCTINGDCPNYTAGGIASNTTPAACAAHYAGQIGVTNYPSACVAHDAGRIGN
jgi:hypothetical protein